VLNPGAICRCRTVICAHYLTNVNSQWRQDWDKVTEAKVGSSSKDRNTERNMERNGSANVPTQLDVAGQAAVESISATPRPDLRQPDFRLLDQLLERDAVRVTESHHALSPMCPWQ